MSIQKLRETLEYTYSESFRNIYDEKSQQNLPTQQSHRQSPTKIFIQYQKAPITIKSSKKSFFKDQKSTHQQISQTINTTTDNLVKRLHTSAKKYSFSVFVKKSKKNEQERKTKTNSLEQKFDNSERKIKGSRQINSVIRTMYDNFRKFENMSKRSDASKSSRNSSFTQPKQPTTSPQLTPQSVRVHTKTSLNNNSTISHRHLSHPCSQQADLNSHNKINFIKTLTFGQKLQHSRELQNFRANQSSRGLLCITKQQIPFVEYNQTQYAHNTFLKIQKCSLQKKDQQFMKQSNDFRDALLRQKLQKDNKKKAADLINYIAKQGNGFAKYAETTRENKYIAEMRGAKKAKKQLVRDNYHKEEDSYRNKISPW